MSKTYSKTRILVECALMIAIGTVLSNIKFFTLPNGGSVTLLSMLPFVLVSFRHGVKWGLFTGFVNGCLQMLLGFWAPPTPTFLYFLGEVLLDYLVAFMALGTAEFFARPFKNRMVGVAVGTFMAGFLRFMCSFLSEDSAANPLVFHLAIFHPLDKNNGRPLLASNADHCSSFSLPAQTNGLNTLNTL